MHLRRVEDCEPIELGVRDGVHASPDSCTPGLPDCVSRDGEPLRHGCYASAAHRQPASRSSLSQKEKKKSMLVGMFGRPRIDSGVLSPKVSEADTTDMRI